MRMPGLTVFRRVSGARRRRRRGQSAAAPRRHHSRRQRPPNRTRTPPLRAAPDHPCLTRRHWHRRIVRDGIDGHGVAVPFRLARPRPAEPVRHRPARAGRREVAVAADGAAACVGGRVREDGVGAAGEGFNWGWVIIVCWKRGKGQ